MTDAPHEVLSEHFQERLSGRDLVAAVFTTFQFEPGFFEQEVLPIFLDVGTSHAVPIRLARLELELRRVEGGVAVYYDANGLEPADSGSARLNVRRIPIQHKAIFHSKLVMALVREREVNDAGERPEVLLVAALSANLTRTGWWKNVEVCHCEELFEGASTRLRDDLLGYLSGLKRQSAPSLEHAALDAVSAFLSEQTKQRSQKSQDGRLLPHFHGGTSGFIEFLRRTAKQDLQGMALEIISPYFSKNGVGPLAELIKELKPSEVRVFLPRDADGSASCSEEFYDAANKLEGVQWGHLPRELVQLGKAKELGERFVHAKVYRFFRRRPKRELLFVGSLNLTTPAHQVGGNDEAGFLVEPIPPRCPDFWLEPDDGRPKEFKEPGKGEELATSGGTSLQIRFNWTTREAEAYWGGSGESPTLDLVANGAVLFKLASLPAEAWHPIAKESASRLEELLRSTSLLEVRGEGPEPGLLLVQEEGMLGRPPLLLQLSVADILRYWAQMTEAQRALLIEQRGTELLLTREGSELLVRVSRLTEEDSIFDKMAGIFHAFGCRERAVIRALQDGKENEARYMLFGRSIDSLGCLLERLCAETERDPVDRYLIYLCARQMCAEVKKTPAGAELWRNAGPDRTYLTDRLVEAEVVRSELLAIAPEETEFLKWFDEWFLRKAKPQKRQLSETLP